MINCLFTTLDEIHLLVLCYEILHWCICISKCMKISGWTLARRLCVSKTFGTYTYNYNYVILNVLNQLIKLSSSCNMTIIFMNTNIIVHPVTIISWYDFWISYWDISMRPSYRRMSIQLNVNLWRPWLCMIFTPGKA